MSSKIQYIIKSILYFFIIWFICYFAFGEYIKIEFSNYKFAYIFPKILTFAAGASLYFLVLFTINLEDKFKLKNILKILLALVFGAIPFFLFKYYSSVGNCQSWEIYRHEKKTIYQSSSSSNESIKLIESYCPEMDLREVRAYQVMKLTPLFNTVNKIDTTKINHSQWKKIK